MRIRHFLVGLSLFSVLLMQCKSNQAQTSNNYDNVLKEKFSNGFVQKYNPARTYVLLHSTDSTSGSRIFHYAVVQLKNKEVVLEGKYNRGGYVKWVDDTKIELLSIPRHVRKVPDTAMYKREIFLENPN